MAAATTIIAGTAALAGAGLGIGQAVTGAKQRKESQRAINESVKELRSMIEEGQANKLRALQIPTMGAELQERALARSTAGQLDAMQQAGAAAVIGGAGRLSQAVGEQGAAIASDLDRMQSERDRLVLQEDQRLENQRFQGLTGLQQMEVQGAQQAQADAIAQQQAGIQGAAGSLGMLSETFAGLANPYGKQKNTSGQAETFSDIYRQLPESTQQGVALGMETFNIPGLSSPFYPK